MIYWKWEKVIPVELCDLLLRDVGDIQKKRGLIEGNKEPPNELRNNKTAFLKENHWFEGIMLNHIYHANQSAKWNFELAGCENLQYAEYFTGEKYDWHRDHNMYDMENPEKNYRKLTAVCQLSDFSEFEGGGTFLVDFSDSLLKNKGDLIVFPSHILHKAGEVTSGVRKTIVCWAYGPKFK
jgi:predicted 2-oxoglutarate/Fe(II)-dependent dioxygenase YbiX